MADVERARALRKKETWAEKSCGVGCVTGASAATNFAASIRKEFTVSISFAKKRTSPSNSMVRGTAIPTGRNTTPNARNSWLHKELKFCGFGILICGGTPKASGTRFLKNCRGVRRIRCRITRDRCWEKLVEHPPSPRPSPPGRGFCKSRSR